MATKLSRNLKLRIRPEFTADTKYNLEKLDQLGAVYTIDSTGTVRVRAQSSIILLPNDASADGSGKGGTVGIGTEAQPLDALDIWSNRFDVKSPLGLLDQAGGGDAYLRLRYASDLGGTVDAGTNRQLSLSTDGEDRSLLIKDSGTAVLEDSLQALSRKTIDGRLNELSHIKGEALADDAAIAYSKLNLDGSITNKDIHQDAQIDGSKVVPVFGEQNIKATGYLELGDGTYTTQLAIGEGQTSHLAFKLPPTEGRAGEYLRTEGSGQLGWATLAGSGTVTSVRLAADGPLFDISGSPITVAGTLQLTPKTQAPNRVFAGPQAPGTPGQPTFRPLVREDLPALTTDDVGEGTHLYYSDSRVDGRVDESFKAGEGIVLTRDFLTGDFTIEGEVSQYTDAMAKDAVGGLLHETPSIRWSYTGPDGVIEATAKPAGIDHDSLANWEAGEHIDHSSVTISTGLTSGLSGGGDISSSRDLQVDPSRATAKATPSAADELLIADAEDGGALKKATLASLSGAIGVKSFKADWGPSDGTSLTLTHSLGTRDILVQLYDEADGTSIAVDEMERTDTNNIKLTASEAPGVAGWRVLILAL